MKIFKYYIAAQIDSLMFSIWPSFIIVALNLMLATFNIITHASDWMLLVNAIGVAISIRTIHSWYLMNEERKRLKKLLETFWMQHGHDIIDQINELHRIHSDESNSDKP